MNSTAANTSGLGLRASPHIQSIETRLNILGALSGAGYLSVFDIIQQPKSRFIRRNKGLLKKQSEQAYDLALGLANQVRRAFRKNQLTASVQKTLPRTLSGQRAVIAVQGSVQQGLMTGGPTWQTQFSDDWRAYCQSGAPEANDSPVAYLTWLYNEALSFEQSALDVGLNIISLADRRPDLSELLVDDEAINQVVPSLQLVNQMLKAAIAPGITDSTVDEKLALTRYPSLLPYHYPHDQAELALDNAGVALSGVIGQTDKSWPYFVSATLTGSNSEQACALDSQLAPGQQAIITEAANAASTDFYTANFGYDTESCGPFADPDLLAYQVGITTPQLEQLIASDCGGAETAVVASPNVANINADASQYGAVFVNSADPISVCVDAVSGSAANELLLSTNAARGAYPETGRYGAGLATNSEPDSYAYFDSNSDVAKLLKGDQSFTLGFWIYYSDYPGTYMPVFSNGADANSSGAFPGFSMSVLNSSGGAQIAICDDTGVVDSSNEAVITPCVWQYISLVWDVESKSAGLYILKETASATEANVTLHASTASGSILTADGCTWAFNTRGNLTLDKTPTKDINDFIYDEIAIFAGCLTVDDINLISASQVPLSGIVDSLSIKPTHYYPLEDKLRPINLERFSNGYDDILNGSAANRLLTSLDADHVTSTTGNYDKGLATYTSPTSYAYFDPKSDVAMLLKGDRSFTLGFCINRPNYTKQRTPIFSNGGDFDSDSYSAGFNLSTNVSDKNISFGVCDSDGVVASDSWAHSMSSGKWDYVALVWDAKNKSAKLYLVGMGSAVSGPTITIDASNLGSISTASGFTWAFNVRGDLTLSEIPTEDINDFIYDEIAVFPGCLTDSDISLIISSTQPLSEFMDSLSIPPSYYYPLEVYADSLENLSDPRMDRINRVVRLQRWLDLPYELVDLLLSACIRAQGVNNTDFSSNTHTLRMLGVFRHFLKKYQITACQFAAVIDRITPYAISPNVPFFDQIFNSPSLFETPFAITGDNFNYPPTTPADERIVKQLCAGLEISEAQFGVLASHVMTQLEDPTNKSLPCSLSVVSAFYRLAMLPRWMGLSFAEGAALFSLLTDGQTVWDTLAGVPLLVPQDGTGSPQTSLDILDVLMALDSAIDWAKNHTQSWIKNYLVLQDTLTHPVPTTDILNVVTSISQQLPAALLTETDLDSAGVPAAPDDGGWMGALSGVLDANGLVQPVAPTSGATVYDTLSAAVTTVVDKLIFDASVTLTDEQIVNSLTTVIYQALLTQNGIADSALAQLLGTPQSLSTFLLQWASDSEYRLLSDTLALAGITAPADIPDAYLQALYQLGRRASVVTQFHLTPATLNCFLANPTWFGVADNTLTLTLLYRLSRYADWLTLSGKEDAVLAYLNWVHQGTPPSPATAATALAVLLDWDSSEVTDAAAWFGSDGLALTVTDVDGVMRLQTLSKETGLSVAPLLSTGALTLSSDYSDWQAAGESLVAAQSAQS